MSSLIYDSLLEWNTRVNALSKTQFLENTDLLPTAISFILGTITSGFLKQIGEEVWQTFKKIFIKKDKKVKKEMPSFEFKFNYQGIEILAELESDDPKELELAFNNLTDILKSVTDEEKKDRVKFVLDGESGDWVKKN